MFNPEYFVEAQTVRGYDVLEEEEEEARGGGMDIKAKVCGSFASSGPFSSAL